MESQSKGKNALKRIVAGKKMMIYHSNAFTHFLLPINTE
jgi:hypothetical protein